MLDAFLGDAAVRSTALQRLQVHLAANHLTSGALFWNGEKSSVAAALVESNDPQVWQERLGLAKWMAYALDLGVSTLPPEKAAQVASDLLDAVRVGADTSLLGSHVINAVLSRAMAAPGAMDPTAVQPLLAPCEEIRALHARALRGDRLDAREWRAARRRSTEATNAASGDNYLAALGACIEAAAWDPVTAPTTVGEVLRLWIAVGPSSVDAKFGWTEDDTRYIKRMLGNMYETYIKDHPEEQRDVFLLLREHHPDDEARLLAYTKFQNAERARFAEEGARMMLDSVREADR